MNPAVAAALPIQGWMSEAELAWLADQASRRQVIVEFGCYKGRSTKALAASTPGRVYALDHWSVMSPAGDVPLLTEFLQNLRPELEAGKVLVCRGPTDYAERLVPVVPDMVFIDASHRYEQVSRDIDTAQRLLRGEGLLCGHDYSQYWPDVKRAVEEKVPGFSTAEGTHIWFKELG